MSLFLKKKIIYSPINITYIQFTPILYWFKSYCPWKHFPEKVCFTIIGPLIDFSLYIKKSKVNSIFCFSLPVTILHLKYKSGMNFKAVMFFMTWQKFSKSLTDFLENDYYTHTTVSISNTRLSFLSWVSWISSSDTMGVTVLSGGLMYRGRSEVSHRGLESSLWWPAVTHQSSQSIITTIMGKLLVVFFGSYIN